MLGTCVDNLVLDFSFILFGLNWFFTFILCCFRVWKTKVSASGQP